MSDTLALFDSAAQKMKSVIVSFMPPILASLIFPYGFVNAIGLAGLFVAFSFFVIPGVMFKVAMQRSMCAGHKYQYVGVIFFGTVIFVLKIGLLFSLLPNYLGTAP